MLKSIAPDGFFKIAISYQPSAFSSCKAANSMIQESAMRIDV